MAKKKGRFIDVDVWRSEFSDVSTKAIYELYRVKSGCTQVEFKNTSFPVMVDYLRKLEKPEYIPYKDRK